MGGHSREKNGQKSGCNSGGKKLDGVEKVDSPDWNR